MTEIDEKAPEIRARAINLYDPMPKKRVILFDLDGTLCDISHRLHYIKNGNRKWDEFYAACVDDVPKPEIITLFQTLKKSGFTIFITSGRSNKVLNQTTDWLRKYDVFPAMAIFRKHGDSTPDDELKRNWLRDGKLGDKDNILFAIDDRQRVVDMWRAEGLTCLQVAAWSEEK